MNQLMVDTRARTINILRVIDQQQSRDRVKTKTKTYIVVKFMVKVKLIEKSVKSHVGSVSVANVIIE